MTVILTLKMDNLYKVLLVVMTTLMTLEISMVTGRHRGWQNDEGASGYSRKSKHPINRGNRRSDNRRSDKPNIVFILTDDQDYDLKSMNFMPKTLRLLRDEGAFFPNAYVTTPMCCPSRSSILTGMYAHNHHVFTNNDNCSNIEWQQTFEINNFGRYLSDAGYRTGYFGKYLNEYQGTYIPPGWTEWVGLVRNTRYYNYSLNFNGEKIKHGDDYHKDYLTDLIANDSVTFLKQSKQYFPNRPVAMVLSMPAPHGPEDSAPQYQHLFNNVTSYRTPSWNYAPNPDKQWLLQNTGKMEPIHIAFTDMLQQKRLQTLQSVDDAVEKLYNELKHLGELDNTYFLYSSDHGYHLGQYGLLKGKAMPYEFDIKVPFYMRGPKIPKGSTVQNIVLNVDIAPTFLDIAGIEAPDHIDGRSVLKLFEDTGSSVNGVLKRKKAWRDTFLVERGKVTQRKIKERERLEAEKNIMHMQTKENRLKRECQKAEYQPPCSAKQQWECRKRPDGMLRMYKCRQKYAYKKQLNEAGPTVPCVCPELKYPTGLAKPSKKEKKQQKEFLYTHVSQPDKLKPKFMRDRYKRSVRRGYVDTMTGGRRKKRQSFKNKADRAVICKVLNETVVCREEVFTNPDKWKQQKSIVEDNIQKLKEKLDSLRDIKKHLQKKKPDPLSEDDEELNEEASGNQPIATETSPSDENEADDISLDSLNKTEISTSRPRKPKPNKKKPQKVESSNEYEKILDEDLPHDNDLDELTSVKSTTVSGDGPVTQKPEVTETTSKAAGDDLPEWKVDSETDYDDGNDYQLSSEQVHSEKEDDEESEFHPEDFQDESDRKDNVDQQAQCERICNGMMSDQQMSSAEAKKLKRIEKRRERKMENRSKKRQKYDERERKRQEKQALKAKSKKKSSRKNKDRGSVDPTRDCSAGNMKCFEHNNDHWRTPPLWSTPSTRKVNNKGARRDPACNKGGMECSRMDNDHWRTRPFWNLGPFCFCPNSNNNTYWCMRTINESHNYMYCEFITGFISYYDFVNDPHQLRNAVRDLSYITLNDLHKQLEKLKGCKGARECTERTRPNEGDRPSPQKAKKDKKKLVAVLKDKTTYHSITSKSRPNRSKNRYTYGKW